jgi:hypothetical protein
MQIRRKKAILTATRTRSNESDLLCHAEADSSIVTFLQTLIHTHCFTESERSIFLRRLCSRAVWLCLDAYRCWSVYRLVSMWRSGWR